MSFWLVRGNKRSEDEERALDGGYAFIGFRDMPDLSGAGDRGAMMDLIKAEDPDLSMAAASNYAAQLLAFAHRAAGAVLRSTGPAEPGRSADRSLSPPNRRIRDPYVRWCGRREIARSLPIPISCPTFPLATEAPEELSYK
jgi:hypothetical protein